MKNGAMDSQRERTVKLREAKVNSVYVPYAPRGKRPGVLRNRDTIPASYFCFEYDHKGGCEVSMRSYEDQL